MLAVVYNLPYHKLSLYMHALIMFEWIVLYSPFHKWFHVVLSLFGCFCFCMRFTQLIAWLGLLYFSYFIILLLFWNFHFTRIHDMHVAATPKGSFVLCFFVRILYRTITIFMHCTRTHWIQTQRERKKERRKEERYETFACSAIPSTTKR